MAAKQLEGHPGDRIGDLRTNLGMTKKELSRKTGIPVFLRELHLCHRVDFENCKSAIGTIPKRSPVW